MLPCALSVSLCVGALSLMWLYRRMNASRCSLPPGPKPRLFTGNYNLITNNDRAHVILADLRSRYGELVSLRFGMQQAVVLNSYASVKEALVSNGACFSDRPQSLLFRLFRGSTAAVGVTRSSGEAWREMRKFLMSALKSMGMGKARGEKIVEDEASHLICQLSKHTGKPLNLSELLANAAINIIDKFTCDTRFDKGESENSFTRNVDILLRKGFLQGGIFKLRETFMPWLLPLSVMRGKGAIDIAKNLNKLKLLCQELIDDHYNTFEIQHIRDIIDYFIKRKKGDSVSPHLSDGNFLEILIDVYGAGTDTSKLTLLWAVLFLLHYPEVQVKCKAELEQAIGQRQVCMADEDKLPYVCATLYESMRLRPVAPLALQHTAKEDARVMGYTIPKGTFIIPNIYAAMRDPDHWENPNSFCPERWLSNTGQIKKFDAFIPFSTGPRICPGEGLAKVETFIILSSLLQNFTLHKADPNAPPPSMDGILGISFSPEAFEVILEAA